MHLYVDEPPNLSKLYQRVWYESCAGPIPGWLPGWCWFAVSHRCQKGQRPGGFWSDANPIWMDSFFARNITSNWLNWFHGWIGWIGFIASVEHHMFFKIWMEIVDGCYLFGWIGFMVSSFIRQIINHPATTFNNHHQFLTWINIQKYSILHTMKLFVEYRMDSSQPVPLLVHLNIS